MKKCTVCLIEKEDNQFYKKRNGLEGFCKQCRETKRKSLHNANPEKYKSIGRERSKKRRIENPEAFKKWRKQYLEKNKEKIQKQAHENYLKNKEKVLERTKKWRIENKEKFNKMWRNSIERHPLKYAARRFLNHAIEFGKIERPVSCSRCEKSSKVEAHHEDYSRPLDVIWLCRKCHALEHRKFKDVSTSCPS